MRQQPAERADAQPVARRAVGAGVGEEPADDADRQADHQRRGRGGHAAEQGDRDQRATRCRGVGAALRAGSAAEVDRGSSEVMVRPSSPAAGAGSGASHAESARIGGARGYRGRRHDGAPTSSTSSTRTSARRLLLLTYCLTGDLPASRAAVRDAFVVAWHHWRKVSRLEDPEAWVRAHACRARRSAGTPRSCGTARRASTPRSRRTLDALGRLPITQRRVLLLTELTTLLAGRRWPARSGSPGPRPSASCRPRPPVRAAPRGRRPPSVRGAARAGPRRTSRPAAGRGPRSSGAPAPPAAVPHRRSASPRRRRAGRHRHPGHRRRRRPPDARRRAHRGRRPAPTPRPTTPAGRSTLPEERDARRSTSVAALRRRPAAGRSTGTDDNTGGDGLVVPCQQSRYADPRGDRPRWSASSTPAAPPAEPAAVRRARPPRSRAATGRAGRGYDTAVGWFAGCRDDRGPAARDASESAGRRRRGDAASCCAPGTEPGPTMVVGVARTGSFTTTTVSTAAGADGARRRGASARLLGRGRRPALRAARRRRLRDRRDAARRDAPRCRSAPAPGMLAEVDLPPVAGRRRSPWVGTEPRRRARQRRGDQLRPRRLQRGADDQQPDPDVPGAGGASCPTSSG